MGETHEPNCQTCGTRIYWNIISQAWIHGDRSHDDHSAAEQTPSGRD